MVSHKHQKLQTRIFLFWRQKVFGRIVHQTIYLFFSLISNQKISEVVSCHAMLDSKSVLTSDDNMNFLGNVFWKWTTNIFFQLLFDFSVKGKRA